MSDVLLLRHERDHYYGYGSAVPIALCWFCQKNERRCRAKVRYEAPREATDHAKRLVASGELGKPVLPYSCQWCGGWHLTSRLNRKQLRKAEKWRRKAMRPEAV